MYLITSNPRMLKAKIHYTSFPVASDKPVTSWQLPRLRGSYRETCVMDFGHYCAKMHLYNISQYFVRAAVSVCISTPWAIKRCHFYFYDNFGKCGPISIIPSLLDS